MKHKILETKNQVKLQLYEAYLTRQAIPYKKRYTPISGGYCLYVDKANLSRIGGKAALGDLYGSVDNLTLALQTAPTRRNSAWQNRILPAGQILSVDTRLNFLYNQGRRVCPILTNRRYGGVSKFLSACTAGVDTVCLPTHPYWLATNPLHKIQT